MGNKSLSTYKYWKLSGVRYDGSPSSLSHQLKETYTRSANDNPKYKSVIRSGANATNYLLTKNQSVSFKPGYMRGQYIDKNGLNYLKFTSGSDISISGSYVPMVHSMLPSVLFRADVKNAALIGIIKKIRKFESSDFAGPTFAGELRETISMLRSPVKALRLKTGLFTDLHMRILRDKQAKGGRFKPDPWSKVLSDTWLEWTFGAAPLISDIGAICDLYLEQKTKLFPDKGYKRLSFRFSDDYSSVDTSPKSGIKIGTGLVAKFDQISHFRSSYQYVVWVDNALIFADTSARSLSSAAKFDLAEIVPTAWELMPWSFLIDYWTNIGDVLGCTFDFNRSVAFGKATAFDLCTIFHANFSASANTNSEVLLDFKPWQYTSQYTQVSREALTKLSDFPQLSVQFPSVGQFQNMAALFRSLSNSNPFRGHTLK